MLTPMRPSEFQNTLNTYIDFHRTYLFRVMFFDGLIGALKGAFVTTLISTADTPTSSTTAIDLPWQGSKVKVAGKTDFPDWKVTVRDDAINAAYTYFQDWRNKVYNVKSGESSKVDNVGLLETIGLFPGYKKSAIVILLANNIQSGLGSGSPATAIALTTRAYLLNGIWPKDLGAIALDYTAENISTFVVNFAMDSFEPYSLTSAISGLISGIT